jgi:hypothetical protein
MSANIFKTDHPKASDFVYLWRLGVSSQAAVDLYMLRKDCSSVIKLYERALNYQ